MRYIVLIIVIPVAVFICYYVGLMIDSFLRKLFEKPEPDTTKVIDRILYFVWIIALGAIAFYVLNVILKKIHCSTSPYEPYQ